jgi:predicted ATPase/class 3 adenylate cyclase
MDAADLPNGRLTFFFSDVEGSTRLLTDLGDRYPALLADHQAHIRAAFAAHDGLEISTEGDSFFAVFRSSVDGVRAAADVQQALAAHDWPEGRAFRVRIGLHVGQAIVAGTDYVGIDINRAARIANAANGGQVIASDELASEVAGELPTGTSLRDLGRHRLKDIGVVHLWQFDVDGLPTRFGALRSLEAHPTNVPPETTALVDRETEARALVDLVSTERLVTITGTGGIGKSRLAIAVARRLVADFADGVFYIDLASVDRVETAAAELAAITDARVAPGDDPTDVLLDLLRDRRVLILLETADRPPGIAALVARMVERCPSARLLVTARSALRLRAEREFPLAPLAVPETDARFDDAVGYPAVEVFVRRAHSVGRAFEVTEANVAAIAAIVRRLDGLPLAIELAAAATRILSPAGILKRLEGSLPLPGGADVDAPERQRTVHDAIAWSYELLEPEERSLLARLSVFAGAFDLDGVMGLSAPEPGGGPAASDEIATLGALVDRNLVHRAGPVDDDRFRLLNVIREFAAGELAASGELETVRARHAALVLDVARRNTAALDGPGQMAALASLDDAGDETRAALDWSIASRGDPRLGLELACALGRSWYLRGRVVEATSWLEEALAGDPDAPPELRASALHWLGVMLDEQRDETGAAVRLAEALEIERELGDEQAIARELNSLGVVKRNLGEVDAADVSMTESLTIQRRLGDRAGIATSLTNLGILAIDRRRLDDAIGFLEEALALDRLGGSMVGEAYSAGALGTAYLRAGRHAEADGLLRRALAGFHELEDPDGIAEQLERLGEAEGELDPAWSIRLLLAARGIREREGLALRGIDVERAEEIFTSVAGALSAAEMAAARADALAMDADAAVAFALAGSRSEAGSS